MHYTHLLLRKNFLQGNEEQQQSVRSPSNLPSAEDKDSTAVSTDAVVESDANKENDGESYTNCDLMKYMNVSHSRIAL